MNLSSSIIAKSDQLNADDLVSGPRTFTVAKVEEGNAEQPCKIYLAEWPGNRPFKPSKTAMRVLAYAWGEETDDWPPGARMTLFRDESVKWAGQAVGGIRVSALSHIKEPFKIALAESKGKKVLHSIDRLPDAPAPSPRDTLLADIKTAAETAGIPLADIAATWAESHDGQAIKDATDLGGLELLRDELRGRA